MSTKLEELLSDLVHTTTKIAIVATLDGRLVTDDERARILDIRKAIVVHVNELYEGALRR